MITAIDRLNLLDVQLKQLHKQIAEGINELARETNFTELSDSDFHSLVAQITNPQFRQAVMQQKYLTDLYGRETGI
jgi:hypothetical protein